MGYLAKILVVAALFGAIFTLRSQQETSLEANEQLSEDQAVLLARETAESGLRMAASKAQRDFDSWRAGYDQAALDGGNFDVNLEGTAAGPIQVIATGTFGNAQHQVELTLARLAPSPAALLIDADTVEAEFTGSDFVISGRDTRPGSAARSRRAEGKGRSDHVNGVWTRGLAAQSAFVAAAGNEAARLRGQASEGDVAQGSGEDMETFPVHLGQLFLDALADNDEMYAGGVFNNQTYGSAGDPQVIVINGPAVFLGTTRGYGLLVVQGGIAMHDDFEWEGLILARQEDNDMDVLLADNACIYGALVARHGSTSGSEEEEGEEVEECSYLNGGSGPPAGNHVDPSHSNKRLICHIPPGNPENAHTISVSVNAVQTHFDHHDDYDGDCSCELESGEEGGEGGAVGGSGALRFAMRDNAAIYYSTEALGKLAARLPLVKNASWIVKFDQIGEDLGHEYSEGSESGEQEQ